MNTSETIHSIETAVPILTASVKVMRSFDYCHFEVSLSTSLDAIPQNDQALAVDHLRKTAARLVDKAVTQYQQAKENLNRFEHDAAARSMIECEAKQALDVPESERTARQRAAIKWLADKRHMSSRRKFNYEDDWDEPDYGSDPEDLADEADL